MKIFGKHINCQIKTEHLKTKNSNLNPNIMKKAAVLILTLILFSCNSDNSDDSTNVPQLIKMEQLSYDNGVLEERIVFEYDNQKPTKATFFNGNNILTASTNFIYNSNGLLAAIKNYSPNSILVSEMTITYNSLNRITKTDRVNLSQPDNHTTVDFTYNPNNTISSVYTSGINTQERTFELNSNGLIHKEIFNGNVITSVTYDNLKPITKTSYSETYTYSYHCSGIKPISNQAVFGSYYPNTVLFENSLDDFSDELTDALITEIVSTNENERSEYTLNSNNFPATRMLYRNDVLRYSYIFTYR